MPTKTEKEKKNKATGSGVVKKREHVFVDSTPILNERNNNNIICRYDDLQMGRTSIDRFKKIADYLVSDRLKQFDMFNVMNVFERRVTAISWNPMRPYIVAVGSKGGEMLLTDVRHKGDKFVFHHGTGPGGSILSIAFDPNDAQKGYTACLDGALKRWNFTENNFEVLLDTRTFDKWYCSVDASSETGLVVAGDTAGELFILDKDNKLLSKHKLHKNKINMVEFSHRCGYLLATCSVDRTVKLWDVRNLNEKSPMEILHHDKPVNSAYFSRTDSEKLLTTDQHSQLRVYKAPNWTLDRTIAHPHRQFQHLTAIKASWHPSCDLIVVGRYPDPNFPGYIHGELRTVDVFSAETGKLHAQLFSSESKGIISLNVFNPTGEYLASGMGLYIPFWKWFPPSSRSDTKRKKGTGGKFSDDDSDDDDDDNDDKKPKKKLIEKIPRPRAKSTKTKPSETEKKKKK